MGQDDLAVVGETGLSKTKQTLRTLVEFLQAEAYQSVLACSDVHLYLTVPFVLSWSLLEAMAAGCCIVASDTAPVREVLIDGETGVLVDFFSSEDQANAIEALLDSKGRRQDLSDSARRASAAYDCNAGLKAWIELA